jgi:hypothetical protein
LLTALAAEKGLRWAIESEVGGINPDCLGDPGPGASQEEKECVIPPTKYGGSIRRLQEGVHFGDGQMARGLHRRPLAGNLQHLLRDADGSGIARSDVTEEGTDRCETRIPRSGPVSAVPFEMIEEVKDKLAVEVRHLQFAGLPAVALRSEENKKPQCVSVARDSQDAHVPLFDEPPPKEGFEKSGQGR